MRSLLLAAAVAAIATPSLAEDATWLLQPGLYCPVERNVQPILVGPRPGMGIDGLDCATVRFEGSRIRAKGCYADGGSRVDYDTDLLVLPSGALVHDGTIFRRYEGPRPCPRG